MDSLEGKGSLLWYTAKPTRRGTLIRDDWTCAMRRTLNLDVSHPTPCFQHPQQDPLTELHGRTCNISGLQVTQHNSFQREVVREVIKGTACLPVEENVSTPFQAFNQARPPRQGRELTMDAVIRAGAVATNVAAYLKNVMVDFSIGEPCCPTNLRTNSPYPPGHAAAKLSTEHHNKYSPAYSRVSYTLKVFAVETYGRLGLETEDLLRTMAYSAAGGPAAQDRFLYSQLIFRMRRDTSLALQRQVSARTLSHVRRSLTRAGRMATGIE
jgi:hypothetical protein